MLAIGVDLISPDSLSSSNSIAEKIRLTKKTYQRIKEMVNESSSPLLSHLKGAVKDGKIRREEIECLMAVVVHALAPLHTVFWVCYCLACNPEVQGKLALEIDTTLQSGEISYTKLSEMTYLNKVVLETLRLYPGVALLQPRYPESDTTLGPHRIPKGSTLLIFPYLCHRNGKYYKNPDTFNCERSELNTNLNSDGLKYFPFGYGPRICQGQFYAECLVKAAVISIVRRHAIKLVDGEPAIYGEEIGFCRPSQNVNFIISERKSKTVTEIPPSSVKKVEPQAVKVEQQHPKAAQTHSRKLTKSIANQTQFFTEWIKDNKLDTKKAKFQESLLVLYASQSGKSKDLAMKLAKIAQLMEHFVSCRCVSEYDFSLLRGTKLVVVVTSTYGNGEPPINGVNLYQFLNEPRPSDYLKDTKYAVLKVGSTVYSEPFAFGNFVDSQMKKFGASRIVTAGEIDEIKYNDEADFSQFVYNLFSSYGFPNTKLPRTRSIGFLDLELFQPRLKLVEESDSQIVPQKVTYRGFFLEEVIKNEQVTDSHEIYEMEIKNSNNLAYQVGDEVCVFPQNSSEEVDQLINQMKLSPKLVFRLYSESNSGAVANWNDVPTSLSDCLKYYFDINSVSPSLLRFFAACSKDSSQKKHLEELSGENYANFAIQNANILDILESHPSVVIESSNLPNFLGLLKELQPRYYSVASSSKVSKGILRIIYKLIKYQNSKGKQRHGVCSGFLASRKHQDKVFVKIQPSTFRLPANPSAPVIMICGGTGVSPFVGFVEERGLQKTSGTIGNSVLAYGCTARNAMIGSQLWEKAIQNGYLDYVLTAFSREGERVYIQDKIVSNFDEIWKLIERGAYIYSCGDVKLGIAVKEAITNAIASKNNWSNAEASEYVRKLISSRRYQRSEWGLQEAPMDAIKSARFRLWARSVILMIRVKSALLAGKKK